MSHLVMVTKQAKSGRIISLVTNPNKLPVPHYYSPPVHHQQLSQLNLTAPLVIQTNVCVTVSM